MIFRPIAYSEHLLSQYEICSFSIRFTALPKFFPCYDVTSREYNFAFIYSKYPTLGARSMKTKTPLDMRFFALKQIFHGEQLYWNSLKSHLCCHKYFKETRAHIQPNGQFWTFFGQNGRNGIFFKKAFRTFFSPFKALINCKVSEKSNERFPRKSDSKTNLAKF